MTIPQEFDSGQWHVSLAQGIASNNQTNTSYPIALETEEVKQETLVTILNQIANKTFAKAVYLADGKLYVYTSADEPNPVVQAKVLITIQGGQDTNQLLIANCLKALDISNIIALTPITKLMKKNLEEIEGKTIQDFDTETVSILDDFLASPMITNDAAKKIKYLIYYFSETSITTSSEDIEKAIDAGDTEKVQKLTGQFLNEYKQFRTLLILFLDEFSKVRSDYYQTEEKEAIQACQTLIDHKPNKFHLELKNKTDALIFRGAAEEAFKLRAQAAERLSPPPNHPLHSMDAVITEQTAKETLPIWGAYFSNFDTKGGYIHAFRRNIEGQEMNGFDFKIPNRLRKSLNVSLEAILNDPLTFYESLPKGLCEGVFVKEAKQVFRKMDDTGAYTKAAGATLPYNTIEIEFIGLGKVIIGTDPYALCLYNWVNIEMIADLEPGVGILKLNQVLTMIGIGPILLNENPEVMQRIQIATLTKAFYPNLIARMEKREGFYEIPIEMLKEEICAEQPEMGDIFQKYLVLRPDLMRLEEVFPGLKVWAVNDIANQIRAAGGVGLMAGMGHADSIEEVCNNVVSRLRHGTRATQVRFQAGRLWSGISSQEDLYRGGGEHAFLRMFTNAFSEMPIRCFPFYGKVQVLYDLPILNRGGYAYYQDTYGSKLEGDYENRDDIPTVTRNLMEHQVENEVMVKFNVPQESICGVVVQSRSHKKLLIKVLRKNGLVVNGRVNNIPVKEFVHARSKNKPFSKRFWRYS